MKLSDLNYRQLPQKNLVELVTAILNECEIEERLNGISAFSTTISEVVDRFVEREEEARWVAKYKVKQ
ncbi:MAG: hypothetical protein QNL04_01065 [SAR324 cluster bacterium]|nr:hypothetical protein [SAR324 cluster bacterium]